MKNQELTIKVYEVDYSFIIKNYLNPTLWQKKWTLFVYKNFKYELWIDSIYTQSEKIYFKIRVTDTLREQNYRSDWGIAESYYETTVDYSLKIQDINFLKNKINTAMIRATEYLEQFAIRGTDEYRKLEFGEDAEEEKLKEIAEEFLDNENVHNDEIRDVYIDTFIDNNKKTALLKDNLLENKKYNIFTDLYLMLLEKTKDKDLEFKIQDKFNIEQIEKLKKSIIEYLEYIETEEWKNEKQDKLDEI